MTYHAIKRAKQRYGLRLDDGDLAELRAMILGGEVASVRPHGGQMRGVVTFLRKMLWIVFDPDTGDVITVLPPGYRPSNPLKKADRLRKACRAAAKAEREFEREQADV